MKTKSSQQGQTFIEFLFLLLVLMGMSYTLRFGVNVGLKERWKELVTIIAAPTTGVNY